MKNIIAVIGANYGDEAKGAYTDYFAYNNQNSIVVRYNGGAQAGHTVVTPEGIRHVFHHFGAGTLAGRPTYLSEFFVNHPMIFRGEWEDLYNKIGYVPKVYVHPDSLVTTPFDMMLNQLKETKRRKSGDHHGSVGVGFGETIERNETIKLTFVNVSQDDDLEQRLNAIRDYFHDAIEKHELHDEYEQVKHIIDSPEIIKNFINDCEFFYERVNYRLYEELEKYDTIIFEGAQGLALDMDQGKFPHVTRSNTGLKNIISILNKNDIDYSSFKVYYISRCYVTRHGAGPLSNEYESLHGFNIQDDTNLSHEYQGDLRFAPLDFDEMYDRCVDDFFIHGLGKIDMSMYFNFSCLDQIFCKSKALYLRYYENLGTYCSYGKTRNDIKLVDKNK